MAAVLLLVQVFTIVAVSRAVSRLATLIGQPVVVGEMVAGVLLGPSLFGWLWPSAARALFPEQGLGGLNVLGQLGLVVFMFLVGVRVEVSHLRHDARPIALLAVAATAVPFVCGSFVGWLWLTRTGFAAAHGWPSILFVGLAMSITAFPVLARILESQQLRETRIGNIAITCAAAGDLSAWVVLAALTWFAGQAHADTGHRLGGLLLFGAFLVGALLAPAMRANVSRLLAVIEPPLTLWLLPVFFAFTGLRTDVTVLTSSTTLAGITVVVVAVAIVSKMIPPMVAANALRISRRESVMLGVLLNTRGMVELVVLNVGFDAGLISAEAFAALVVMAVVTTAMASPVLSRLRQDRSPQAASLARISGV
jgi:Kef-type K+ transport system membrane component KefB